MSSKSQTLSLSERRKFTLFPELPQELRLLIWKHALPPPRIILLSRHELLSYEPIECTRVWSNVPTTPQDPNTNTNPNAFFDTPIDSSSWDHQAPYQPPPCGFRSECPAPVLLKVSREAREVVEQHYSLTFGDHFAFPTTWFDWEIDTLYLGWSWHSLSSTPFGPGDFGDSATRVKHLAIYNTAEDLHLKAEGAEERLCRILSFFTSLETLTLVNRRHGAGEKTGDLVELDPLDLLIWEDYRADNSADVDLAIFEGWLRCWDKEGDGQASGVEDWGTLEPFRKRYLETKEPPWNLPQISRKIILTRSLRDRLARIAGEVSKIPSLTALSRKWTEEMKRDEVMAVTSVEFTAEQQFLYLVAMGEREGESGRWRNEQRRMMEERLLEGEGPSEEEVDAMLGPLQWEGPDGMGYGEVERDLDLGW